MWAPVLCPRVCLRVCGCACQEVLGGCICNTSAKFMCVHCVVSVCAFEHLCSQQEPAKLWCLLTYAGDPLRLWWETHQKRYLLTWLTLLPKKRYWPWHPEVHNCLQMACFLSFYFVSNRFSHKIGYLSRLKAFPKQPTGPVCKCHHNVSIAWGDTVDVYTLCISGSHCIQSTNVGQFRVRLICKEHFRLKSFRMQSNYKLE